MTKITESSSIQETTSTDQSANVDTSFVEFPRDAEKVNGRWAMLGLVALFGAYTSTGQIIPGIF